MRKASRDGRKALWKGKERERSGRPNKEVKEGEKEKNGVGGRKAK